IWREKVGLPAERIVRLGKEDNFWEIGSGPCGPCSEIYFDRGEKYGCGKPGCTTGCDCERYVEIWNLVFTQFNNDGKGNYTPLKQKNIDTGMGLERLGCVMQGVDNLFEVDTTQNVMRHVSEIAGITYKTDEKSDISLRVVTDHIRSTTVLVCDGVLPSNEGRGYVLRRLLRRAARHGKLLGISGPFLADVAGTVIRESGTAYPELKEKAEYIRKVIEIEEDRFQQTIDAGIQQLGGMIDALKAKGEKVFPGDEAFKLYDTYGFPVDLTLEILEENTLDLDMEVFNAMMKAQRERARSARVALGDTAWQSTDFGLDRDLKTEFLGYERMESGAKILALAVDGGSADTAEDGQALSVILDRTPFYAESGGQVGDTGLITGELGQIEVEDVKKLPDGKFVHIGHVVSGSVSRGDKVEARVDRARRTAIMRAHSATHLLQKALRNHLGDHVTQAGSMVEPDRVRFDFTHFSAMTAEELSAVTAEVNGAILEGLAVNTAEMSQDEARKLGAMALFGEKYGETVRVVTMGDYSVELCGGTHTENTAKIGPFKILSEASVASGVRRIEAKVGAALQEQYEAQAETLAEAAALLKAQPAELRDRIRQTVEELKAARRELEKMRAKETAGDAAALLAGAEDVGGVKVLTARLPDMDAAALRNMGDMLRDKEPNLAALLAAGTEKIMFMAVCGAGATERGLNAGKLVKMAAAATGGSGGGKPDSAMGGAKDASKVDAALREAAEAIKKTVEG
ncbi:alanine--tRNA ligase, partial [Oscillospiraceae bacterium OttesenSCG-928-F05]|nr:alanine--tRNA ligase [Oscillospiraceae bacterium OttesenSCG-928-F05]